jgi:purine-binding chemotaxis protein CheW
MIDNEKNSEDKLIATFLLGGGLFGIDTKLIQEVVKAGAITPVHHAPDYVMGIKNLRGRIVTVIDLQVRLGLGVAEPTPATRIMIIDSAGEPVGLLVDGVSDTVLVNQDEVKPPPPGLHGIQGKNLLGVYRVGERLVALLDVEKVLYGEEQAVEPALRDHAVS